MRTVLTARSVEQFKPEAERREIADAHLPGLYLVVQPSGAKSWAVRYRHAGKPRKHTLGPYPALDLVSARERASAAIRAVAAGSDPAAERKEQRRVIASGLADRDLFGSVFAEYLKRHVRPNLRASTARECEALFNREILPHWRDRRIDEIGKRDVLDLIDDIADRGVPLTANKTFAALRTLYNWAIGRDILTASPCAGLKKPADESSRERVLTDDEIRWLWRACGEIGFPFGPIVRLLLLTGTRREEVRGLPERELDLRAGLWTIAAARTKNGNEHEVPLSDAALALLEGVPRVRNAAGLLFTTNGRTPVSGFSRAKRRLDALMLQYAREEAGAAVELEPWRLHDLRRSVASGMARLGASLPVIEKCLNHVSGSFAGIVGVYQRHQFKDEKRAAFAAWAGHVMRLIDHQANVVPLRREG
jgi:integrase